MEVQDVLKELQGLRNEKMVELNEKRGAGISQCGVKLGDIRRVATRIKTGHDLGRLLWKSKVLDARLLACLIMKPKLLSKNEMESMVESIDHVQLADWFNAYILKEFVEKDFFREKWMASKNVWAARSGWSLTAGRIARDPAGLDMSLLLDRIEREMPKAPPDVQWTMNTALANIGIYDSKFRKRAIEIGKNIGLYKNYPVSKGCTSPFAPIWIEEMVKRQK